MKNDTFDFVRMGSSNSQIEQLIVRKKGRPYSDCDESNGRFRCLNECFRRNFRLSRYFYQANEIGSILLDFSERNRTIQESERICFGQCTRENCKLVQLTPVYESKESKIFEAQPMISAFDFCVQLFGRIFLFVSLFFDQIASIAIKLTKSSIRRRKMKIALFYLNLAIILLSLAYSGYLCVRLVHDNTDASDLPEREITRNLVQPKTIHLVICVYKYGLKGIGMTMSELEKATDRMLVDNLESIYVDYRGRSIRTEYQVHRKILFKTKHGYIERCFLLSIHLNYQTIPSNPMLIVRFKKKLDNPPMFYILSEEENLNSKSFEYSGKFAFQKRIVKASRGKCVNYRAKYGNCTGRQNCVERCIGRKFMRRYNRTTFGTYPLHQLVDRNWFSSSEWNTSQLMDIPHNSIHRYKFFNASKDCEEEVPDEKQCDETKFESTIKIQQPNDQTIVIDLQFDVVQSIKENLSSSEMALDLLSMQSIFFGFTLLQLFWLIYRFTKRRWKWKLKDKTDKAVWFFVCLFCSLGCSWNTIRIDDMIINGELVATEHYERAEQIQMPAMMFCFPINQLIDRNHPLTGRYLEKLTRHMDVRSTFSTIAYLNESNEWIPFDLHQVERFFLLNMKCFRIDIDQSYNRNQFHFSDDTQVLRANFKKMEENGLVHFMTQSKETAEFSKISNLDYTEIKADYYEYGQIEEKQKYSITHEASLYEHKDRFDFFRRYFPTLEEGDVGDLYGQLLELQGNEPNRKTLSLPLDEKHFHLEVDEDRFEQLYSIHWHRNGNRRTNLNYQKIFVANHLEKSGTNFKFDFTFNLVFLHKVVHLTNEVSYATLTLSLINLLSIWLELGVLNLRPYLVRFHEYFLVYLYLYLPILLIRKFIKALIFCCRWLRKFEPILYERIDSQWKDEEEEEDAPDYSFNDSSVTYPLRLVFLIRSCFKLFNLL